MVTRVELPSLMHCYDEDWKGRLRKRDRKIIGLRSLFMKTVRKRTLKGIKIGSNCETWKEKRFSIKFMSMIILILSHLCVNMKKNPYSVFSFRSWNTLMRILLGIFHSIVLFHSYQRRQIFSRYMIMTNFYVLFGDEYNLWKKCW